VEMFKIFMESNVDVKISLSTFVKLKPWYVRPIVVCDTCCCRYHVEFELYYETFLNFGIQCWPNDPPPSSVREFVSKILCARENDQVFYKKQCVGGRKCEECSHLALFYVKYPIDPNDPQLSNHIVKWKRYEYVDYTHVTDSTTTSRKIDLVEDDISVTYFMELFREKIYRYIKHSHTTR
jgi:hypothetical protein